MQGRHELRYRRKISIQNLKPLRKISEKWWVQIWVLPVCTPALEPFRAGFLIPLTSHQNVNLKQTTRYFSSKDCFFQISRGLQYRVFSHGEPRAHPHTAREREHFFFFFNFIFFLNFKIFNSYTFYRGKESWVGYSKQRVHGFSEAESLLLPVGPCYSHRSWELPLLVSQL